MTVNDFKYNFSSHAMYEITLNLLENHELFNDDIIDTHGISDVCFSKWVQRIYHFLEELSNGIFYENGYCIDDDESETTTMYLLTNQSLQEIAKHVAICIDNISKDYPDLDFIGYDNKDQIVMFVQDRLIYVGAEECTRESVYNLDISCLLNDLARAFGMKGELIYNGTQK